MSSKVWSSSKIRKLARDRAESASTRQGIRIPTSHGGSDSEPVFQPKIWFDPNENLREKSIEAEEVSATRVLLVLSPLTDDAGEEIESLCNSLGLECADRILLKKRHKPDPANYIGSGVATTMKSQMKALGCSTLVVDAKLSPSQVRNLEEILDLPVLDREAIILFIFEQHAKTHLAKLQVELARLKYLAPRLSGLWLGLSRQRGSTGGLKGRGAGETQLEMDRRVIKDRIALLTRKLEKFGGRFQVQSSRRAHLPRVALVGYTNAGKSTLMRRLTKADVLAQDKLFSTLDTTVRMLQPPTEPQILVSDTVGFVRDLPDELMASFKSTLQEALESRFILHVIDISHPMWRQQFAATDAILNDIGAGEIPKLVIVNKIDLVDELLRIRVSQVKRMLVDFPIYSGCVAVSALTGEGLAPLREKILEICDAKEPRWSVKSVP